MHELLREAVDIQPTLVAHRRTLHQNPELSFKEYQTSAFIQKTLAEMDIPCSVVAETGVVAHIGAGNRCIALRADIDALPIQEESGVQFASQNPGVMHACGHDAHTSMLLGAAHILKQRESELGGVVKLLFQPGEEKLPGGASIMIKEGVLKDPQPERIFGQHVNPEAPVGDVGFCSGPMLASADELYWTIKGRSGHAAIPQNAVDPILIAAHLITQLQAVISRLRNPFDPGVLTVASIRGGNATNVIPDQVEMMGTLRAMDQEWREQAHEAIERLTHSLCTAMGAECDYTGLLGYPPLINDEQTTAFARATAQNIAGVSGVSTFAPKMFAEDFSYYAQEIPGTFWMLGIRSPEKSGAPGLHNSKFVIDEDALPIGAALLASMALESFGA